MSQRAQLLCHPPECHRHGCGHLGWTLCDAGSHTYNSSCCLPCPYLPSPFHSSQPRVLLLCVTHTSSFHLLSIHYFLSTLSFFYFSCDSSMSNNSIFLFSIPIFLFFSSLFILQAVSVGFVVLALTFRSSIHRELIFCMWHEAEVQTHSFAWNIQLSQNHLLKRLFFPHWMVLAPLSKISWPWIYVLFLDFRLYSTDLCVYSYATTTLCRLL